MYQVNITEQMVDADPQEIVTNDNLSAVVDAQIYFRIKSDKDDVITFHNLFRQEVVSMQKQAMQLFVFSFICFIGVFVFGSILGPLQKTYNDPQVIRNLNLFHNHFDQLCWLGAAAIGAVFYATRDRFNGSERILRIFTISYMLGTTLFSFAFLVRALGLIFMSTTLEKGAYIGLISIGGLFNIITIICGVYVLIGIVSNRSAAPQRI